MATLSGNKIKNTYQALVKFSDNGNITTSAKQLTDGFGNNSPIWVSTTQVGIGVTPESGLNLHVYGDAKIGSNLTVIGNLVVEGSTTTVGTDTLTVKDPLIVLANNNTSTDAVDIGFYGKYTPSGTTLYSGLFREALTGKYRLFKGLETEPTTTVNTSGTGYEKADLIIGNIETNGVTEQSTQFLFTKDIRIFDTIPAITLQDSNSSGSASLGDIQWLDNAASQRAVISLNNAILGITSKHGGLNFGTNSTNALTIDGSQNSVFQGSVTTGGDVTVSTGTEGGAVLLGSSASIFSEQGITFKDSDTTIQNTVAGGDIVFKTKTGAGSQNTHLTLFEDGTSTFAGQVTIPVTPTANTDAASKGYVDSNITAQDLDFSGDSGTGSVDLDSQTFALVGTANEIETSAGSQQLQIGLPTNVTIGGAITVGDDAIVSGNITLVDKTTSEVGSILLGSSGDLQIFYDGSNSFVSDSGTGDLILRSNSTAIIKSDTTKIQAFGSSTDFVTIDSSGNVSVGTDTPLYLYSEQDIGQIAVNRVPSTGVITDTSRSAAYINLNASNGGSSLTFHTANANNTAPTERMRIDSSGYVGISVSNPSDYYAKNLVVTGPAEGGITIASTGNHTNYLLFADSTSGVARYAGMVGYAHDTDLMSFRTNSIQRMAIDSSGNVGINASDPVKTLDVRGSLAISNSTASYWYMDRNDTTGNFDLNEQINGTLFTVTPNGNVGIGTTSPDAKLDVQSSGSWGAYGRGSSGDINVENTNTSVNEGGWIGIAGYTGNTANSGFFPMAGITAKKSTASGDGNYGGDLSFWTTAGSGQSPEANSGMYQRMTINRFGNVGIGTDSPTNGKVQIHTASAIAFSPTVFTSGANIRLQTGGTAAAGVTTGISMGVGGAAEAYIGAVQNVSTYADIVFQTYHGAYGERMRITSGGEFGFGTTSNSVQNGSIYFSDINAINTYIKAGHKTGSASGADFIAFYYDGSQIGGAAQSGTTGVAYNTSSDYRLKENVVSMTGALDRVSQLKPSRFNFIADADKTVDGFLAHEVQDIVPEAITGEKDAMQDEEYEVSPAVYEDILHPAIEEELDEDGNIITEAKEEWTENVLKTEAVKDTRQVPDYQGIDQSKLVPLLVGAIQELKAEIELLKKQM